MNDLKKTPTVASFFSGAMGLDIGLEKAFRKPSVRDFGSTPEVHRMLRGVLNDSPSEVAKAIADGADPNVVGEKGLTPLLFSLAHKGHLKGISALLDGGADPNWGPPDLPQPMNIAASDCDGKLLRLFLGHGAKVDVPADLGHWCRPYTGSAVYARCFDNYHLLLDAGADVNAIQTSFPLLVLLIDLEHWDLAVELVARGASIRSVLEAGRTPELLSRYAPSVGSSKRDAYEKIVHLLKAVQ